MEKEKGIAYLRKDEAVEGPAELQMHVHVLLAAHDFQTLDGHHAGGPLERPQIAVARIRRQLGHHLKQHTNQRSITLSVVIRKKKSNIKTLLLQKI